MIATWPPSSGSSGNRLKTPMNMFSPPSSVRKHDRQPRARAASPPIRLAPTTLIGVSGSRSSPPIASIRLGIFDGKLRDGLERLLDGLADVPDRRRHRADRRRSPASGPARPERRRSPRPSPARCPSCHRSPVAGSRPGRRSSCGARRRARRRPRRDRPGWPGPPRPRRRRSRSACRRPTTSRSPGRSPAALAGPTGSRGRAGAEVVLVGVQLVAGDDARRRPAR